MRWFDRIEYWCQTIAFFQANTANLTNIHVFNLFLIQVTFKLFIYISVICHISVIFTNKNTEVSG